MFPREWAWGILLQDIQDLNLISKKYKYKETLAKALSSQRKKYELHEFKIYGTVVKLIFFSTDTRSAGELFAK